MLDSIKAELATVQQFIDLLQQEQAALVNADIDTLLPLASQKSKLADELRQFRHLRFEYLTRLGLSADRAGMEAWITMQPENQHDIIQPLWNALMQAGLTAQRLNDTNGKLISIHMQHNQLALNTLANAANNASVYGPDGQHHPHLGSSGRSLGKV